MRIAILDDYLESARSMADWASLGAAELRVFTEPFPQAQTDTTWDHVAAALAGFDVVVAMRERTRFPRPQLERLGDLRLLVTTGRRNAAIDLDAAASLGVTVCGTGAVPTVTVEHTWALILAAVRRVVDDTVTMRAGGWQSGLGGGLHGRTLGLLGLGNLGSKVATVAHGFGMATIAWSQNLTDARAAQFHTERVSREDLFGRSDILSIHTRLSDRTRGLVTADLLALLPRHAIVVNTSRGPIVDTDALVAALRDGRLGAAALDVYDTEPLPADHPLRTCPNTVLTPHTGYMSREQFGRYFRDAVEDIAAFAAGSPIRVLAGPTGCGG